MDFDIVIIGAGIAGASAAAFLAPHRRVALLEAEDMAGYHTTGRSAATWVLNYGPASVRVLTAASRAFFDNPPLGFAAHALLRQRSVLFLAPEARLPEFAQAMSEGQGLREITVAQARALVPALRPGYAAAAAVEDNAFDIDVAALHEGFLRQFRQHGGVVALRHHAGRLDFRSGQWDVATSAGPLFRAPIVINAAGAWGDDVAALAGLKPLGLTPCRRTGVIIDPAPWSVADWPFIINELGTQADGPWYCRPEARTRLMLSPADETPMPPCDAQPDEMDIAVAVHRMQQALDIPVSRVERSWAGLRTFTPDRTLAIGFEPCVAGFVWCVGQGGYGIQTSPAAGRLVADLVLGRDAELDAHTVRALDPQRFRPV